MVHTLPEPAEFRPSPGNLTPKRGFLEAAPSEGITQAMKATWITNTAVSYTSGWTPEPQHVKAP